MAKRIRPEFRPTFNTMLKIFIEKIERCDEADCPSRGECSMYKAYKGDEDAAAELAEESYGAQAVEDTDDVYTNDLTGSWWDSVVLN